MVWFEKFGPTKKKFEEFLIFFSKFQKLNFTNQNVLFKFKS